MNKIAVVVTAIIALIIGIMGWAAFHYYGKYTEAQTTNAALVQENQANAAIVQNQANLFNLFNTIAGTTLNAQSQNTTAGQDRETVIQTVIKTEPCAVTVVPAAAAGVLLDHYHQLRQSANGADTGQPDGPMPAVAAAK
ncbi:hypothetical protein ABK905_09330 [Acerihabitans sp. KWT182]|uniref:DUF2570 domain-containing protein n=1 Tax=Acerihabitans sp. KWT182 TaxID=3157919 RepID=A0AAU7QDM0_9GAMM